MKSTVQYGVTMSMTENVNFVDVSGTAAGKTFCEALALPFANEVDFTTVLLNQVDGKITVSAFDGASAKALIVTGDQTKELCEYSRHKGPYHIVNTLFANGAFSRTTQKFDISSGPVGPIREVRVSIAQARACAAEILKVAAKVVPLAEFLLKPEELRPSKIDLSTLAAKKLADALISLSAETEDHEPNEARRVKRINARVDAFRKEL